MFNYGMYLKDVASSDLNFKVSSILHFDQQQCLVYDRLIALVPGRATAG